MDLKALFLKKFIYFYFQVCKYSPSCVCRSVPAGHVYDGCPWRPEERQIPWDWSYM